MTEHDIADLAEALTKVGQDAVRGGLVVGSGGNLSARIPGTEEILVTSAGSWLDRPEFSRVRLADGGTVSGPVPTSELALHLAVYRVRPDANAIIHLHPQSTVLLDAAGARIRLITTDHAFYVRRVAVTPFFRPGTTELADAAAVAVVDGTNCVILPHHGCCVLGPDVPAAWRRAANLEEAARLTLQAIVLTGGLPGQVVAECPVSFDDADTV